MCAVFSLCTRETGEELSCKEASFLVEGVVRLREEEVWWILGRAQDRARVSSMAMHVGRQGARDLQLQPRAIIKERAGGQEDFEGAQCLHY